MIAATEGGVPRRAVRTLNSRHLRRVQHGHAFGVLVAMALGLCGVAALWLLGRPPALPELAAFAIMTTLVGLGSSAGYHRHFTHRSFKAATPVRVVLGVLGSMAAQGSILFWVSLHRRHHENADASGDPHSPYVSEAGVPHASRWRGFLHSYLGWTLKHDVPNPSHYAKDLLQDPHISRVSNHYFSWVILGLLLPGVVAYAIEPSLMAFAAGVVWGGLLRILFWHHAIWYITSLAHIWGSKDYSASDESRNNGWLALPTLGESWHNNHHAFPTAAVLSFRWYQLDLSGLVIAMLERVGWAWDVTRPSPRMLSRKSLERGNHECADDRELAEESLE